MTTLTKALLKLGLLALALTVAPVASATTGTKNISANTNLTENHTGTIVFTANNVTLDCKMKTIQPGTPTICNGGKCGIKVDGRSGITMKNCIISGFTASASVGVYINNSSSVTISNVYSDSNRRGFTINNGSGYTITQAYARLNSMEGFDMNNIANLSGNGMFASGNGGDGIDLGDGENNWIDVGSFSANGGNGLEQDGGILINLFNLVTSENSQNGISLDNVYGESDQRWGAWLVGNTAEQNESSLSVNSDGYRLNNVSYVWLDGNLGWINEGWGGYLDDGSSIFFDGNNYFDTCNSQLKNLTPGECGN